MLLLRNVSYTSMPKSVFRTIRLLVFPVSYGDRYRRPCWTRFLYSFKEIVPLLFLDKIISSYSFIFISALTISFGAD